MKKLLLGTLLAGSAAFGDHGSLTITKDSYVAVDATHDHADIRVPYPGIFGVCGIRLVVDVNEVFPVLPMQEIADELKGTWFNQDVEPTVGGNTVVFNVPDEQIGMYVTSLRLTTRDGTSLGGTVQNLIEGYTLKALHVLAVRCPGAK